MREGSQDAAADCAYHVGGLSSSLTMHTQAAEGKDFTDGPLEKT